MNLQFVGVTFSHTNNRNSSWKAILLTTANSKQRPRGWTRQTQLKMDFKVPFFSFNNVIVEKGFDIPPCLFQCRAGSQPYLEPSSEQRTWSFFAWRHSFPQRTRVSSAALLNHLDIRKQSWWEDMFTILNSDLNHSLQHGYEAISSEFSVFCLVFGIILKI